MRYAPLDRRILTRRFETVEIEGVEVAVKVSVRSDGSVATVGPEFRDVQTLARQLGVTEREALRRAREAIDS
ncbi:nickel insertion protein [Dermabacter hominis]|uniref:nickel insertion protein n=1 Tax=Dermabacter hominis TaxID=36740 RepID=UPI003183BE7E